MPPETDLLRWTHWKRVVIFTGAKSASVQPGEWRSSSYHCRVRCGNDGSFGSSVGFFWTETHTPSFDILGDDNVILYMYDMVGLGKGKHPQNEEFAVEIPIACLDFVCPQDIPVCGSEVCKIFQLEQAMLTWFKWKLFPEMWRSHVQEEPLNDYLRCLQTRWSPPTFYKSIVWVCIHVWVDIPFENK